VRSRKKRHGGKEPRAGKDMWLSRYSCSRRHELHDILPRPTAAARAYESEAAHGFLTLRTNLSGYAFKSCIFRGLFGTYSLKSNVCSPRP